MRSVIVARKMSLSSAGLQGEATLGLVRFGLQVEEQVEFFLSDTSLGGELHGAVTAMPLPKLYAAAEAARVVSWELQIIGVKTSAVKEKKHFNWRTGLGFGFCLLTLIISMARCFALFVALVDADSECLPSIGANNVFVAQASSLILYSSCPLLAVQALPSDMHRLLSRGISRSALTPSVGALHFKLDREKASVSRARPGSGRPSQVGLLTLKARLSRGLVGDVAHLQACLEP